MQIDAQVIGSCQAPVWSQVCNTAVAPLHWVAVGRQMPLHPPLPMQAWLTQSVPVPQLPSEPHGSVLLPSQRTSTPGVHTPPHLLRVASQKCAHFMSPPHLPSVPQVWSVLLATHCVAPIEH